MAERQTATNKQKTKAERTELVPKEPKAVTLPEGWREAEIRDRQGLQRVISPEMSARRSYIT